ncbi:hypothetical protein L3X38_020587 [Prunus dulcis]|uniref:Uncharacterized protein n=1 Tax=Prunus dulcis TaxID=3755 RepID=A0AAD4WD69_PRUDU|nr:hypothetical protein L3X38_020587 [Prunus dulcis]
MRKSLMSLSRMSPSLMRSSLMRVACLVDLLELHSASAKSGVYDAESFSASKLKLRAIAFPQLTIGNSALLFLINPLALPGLFEFVEFVDACVAVFAHIAMEAVELVNLSSDKIDNLQFSCYNLQFALVAFRLRISSFSMIGVCIIVCN